MKIPKFNPFPSKNLPSKTKPKNVAEQIANYPVDNYSEDKYLVTPKSKNKPEERESRRKTRFFYRNCKINF